jgi:hypothetical protein
MIRCTVDTNVPIVANGHGDPNDVGKSPSVDCRLAAVKFLQSLVKSGTILLDFEGEIQAEYRTYLNPNGEPGVGDRFYREVLNSIPNLVERVELPRRADGQYADLPQPLIDAQFDPGDRKFAALAKREKVPVFNATDSDWIDHHAILEANGVIVEFLCGYDRKKWFTA